MQMKENVEEILTNHCSAVVNLLKQKPWNGILIQSPLVDAKRIDDMLKTFKRIEIITSPISITGSTSVASILASKKISSPLVLLLININGADYHIWKSIRQIYMPYIICIRFNPTIADHIVFIQAPDANIYQGCSLLALIELGDQACCTYDYKSAYKLYKKSIYLLSSSISTHEYSTSTSTLKVQEIRFHQQQLALKISNIYMHENKYLESLFWIQYAMDLSNAKGLLQSNQVNIKMCSTSSCTTTTTTGDHNTSGNNLAMNENITKTMKIWQEKQLQRFLNELEHNNLQEGLDIEDYIGNIMMSEPVAESSTKIKLECIDHIEKEAKEGKVTTKRAKFKSVEIEEGRDGHKIRQNKSKNVNRIHRSFKYINEKYMQQSVRLLLRKGGLRLFRRFHLLINPMVSHAGHISCPYISRTALESFKPIICSLRLFARGPSVAKEKAPIIFNRKCFLTMK
eukprot:gene1039-2034_t